MPGAAKSSALLRGSGEAEGFSGLAELVEIGGPPVQCSRKRSPSVG
jgi:hypothetical protein